MLLQQIPRPQRLGRRLSGLLAMILLASGMMIATEASPASAGIAEDEAAFVAAGNAARAASGLAGLMPDPAASQIARAWSSHMAATNTLAHNPNLRVEVERYVTTSWERIGENVGYGGSVGAVHDALMNSPAHRANILGDFNRVGTGVAYGGGRIWVTQVFIKGPPLRSSDPFGALDAARQVLGGIQVSGWAIDPDTADPIDVHVYVGSWGSNLGAASAPRPDVGAVFPGYGSSHGYGAVIPANPGWHQVCAYGINVGAGVNKALGCTTVLVAADPFGSLDAVTQLPGALQVSGWAVDPQTSNPIEVHVYVDSGGTNLGVADLARPDVGAMFPTYGAAHGYNAVVPVTPGPKRVCAYGINVGPGANRALGCKVVQVSADPMGSLEATQMAPGGVRVFGWALDPETADPIDVHVYVDSAGTNIGTADAHRTDIETYFPSYGAAHGYDAFVPASPGWHRVCAYGINVGAGSHRALGCKDVLVGADPFGSFEGAVAVPGGVQVGGWAMDPETAESIEVHVYVDSAGFNLGAADTSRPDVDAVFRGFGSPHGYDEILPVAPGVKQVCAYAINVGAGYNRQMGCKSVRVG